MFTEHEIPQSSDHSIRMTFFCIRERSNCISLQLQKMVFIPFFPLHGLNVQKSLGSWQKSYLDFSFIYVFLKCHIYLFSQDVEVIKHPLRSSQNKKMTPKHLDSFPSGFTSIYFEEPKEGLQNTAQTSENDLMHASVLHLHLAELQKILTKERE